MRVGMRADIPDALQTLHLSAKTWQFSAAFKG